MPLSDFGPPRFDFTVSQPKMKSFMCIEAYAVNTVANV